MSTDTQSPSTTATGEVRMLIDGTLVEAETGARFDNVNPATEEVLGPVADASVDDMHQAIAAARRAFDETDWSTNREFRQRCLLQLADALNGEREELWAELVSEVGCPSGITRGPQLDSPLDHALTWPAEMIDVIEWERELPIGTAFGTRNWRSVVKEPAGVVAAIIPWNYPVEVMLTKVGPALAMGNTMIVKPAPDTPWNATRLGRLVAEQTEIPPGVFNVVTTSDNHVAEELVVDPRVDVISFTGSTTTGRRIMAQAAPTVKRLFLELGGKSAHIVLDDADVAGRLAFQAMSTCFHAGQACAAYTRLLVPRSRYDEAIEAMLPGFEAVPYGDPTDPKNVMGPVISSRQRDRVLGYIEQGVAEGARLVIGGGRPADCPKGWFVEPTLFADVDNSMTIAREEIFGPVLCVIPYEGDDEAVRIANDSDYGLSAAVTSGSEERAHAVANRLRVGSVTINGGIWHGPDAPFGGYKASGVGRQNGLEGLEEYLETKTLTAPAAE